MTGGLQTKDRETNGQQFASTPLFPKNYRPDIDGLRALAVLPVIFFHAHINLFKGGFVGVDIFFVISGYVITLMILSENEEGEFKLSTFFARRIARLFPAIFLVIAITTLAAAQLLDHASFERYVESARASLVSLANFHFLGTGDYFAPRTEDMPLLHFWSLAVEEQFYLFWPISLLLLYKYLSRKLSLMLIILAIGTSLSIALYLQPERTDTAFYMLVPRMWELLLGAGVAMLSAGPSSKTASQLSGLAGITLILISIFGIDSSVQFPGIVIILPTLGTAMILWSGHRQNTHSGLTNIILAWRPLVMIGLISYGLYLWHYPLLTLMRLYIAKEPSQWAIIGAITLTFGIAALSYRYYEYPLRQAARTRKSNHPAFIFLICGLVLSLVLLSAAGYYNRGISSEEMTIRAMAERENIHKKAHGCLMANFEYFDSKQHQSGSCLHKISNNQTAKPIPPQNSSSRLLIVGDSHANALAHPLGEILQDHNVEISHISKASCPPASGLEFRIDQRKYSGNCSLHNRNIIASNYMLDNKTKGILLIARWPSYTHRQALFADPYRIGKLIPEKFNKSVKKDENKTSSVTNRVPLLAKGLVETITSIRRARGEKFPIFLMENAPETSFDVPNCIDRYQRTGRDIQLCTSVPRSDVLTRNKKSTEILEAIAAQYENVVLLKNTDQFCDNDRCHLAHKGELLLRDHNHLTPAGVKISSKGWLSVIVKALSAPPSLN